ncbi:hypothetical protein CEUSTIGMA_g10683.t1 [Chlamydomonas eustigma]|uniref:Guanylate cyclase domain-containing protein n=1 Tax=Chlamydomonas eustigma TaxID=1157962 RepID=A0A250XJK7_9CHLO|nr:hypothetical protein CEUSTIGMA_g10683.t1 [Chlamydomonas eustigma]|eukprot:GAX83257.1 hypothetical protein CEUSTIGMA_g10683.t1 [Chlamydomonas eustigma]
MEAENHECVSVLFAGIAGFNTWSQGLPAHKVMMLLNEFYSHVDDILIQEMPLLYKVDMLGDTYMVAGNLVGTDMRHAASMVKFALRMQEEASHVLRPDLDDGSTTLQLRIGIHCGPAVSGIVGKVRRRFTVLGDTVNLASRCETSAPSGCLQVTEQVSRLFK